MKPFVAILCVASTLMLQSHTPVYHYDAQARDFMTRRNAALSDTAFHARPAFIPLSVGAIRPTGWIADWADSAVEGIAGHLDEYAPTFGKGWTGEGIDALGANKINGTGWPLEQCSYWLDGAVRLAYMTLDSTLIEKVSRRLDMVVDGVLRGADNFIYWTPVDISKSGFNCWACSHMGRALVAYWQATGEERILRALEKVYSHFPMQEFKNEFMGHNGIANIDPMLDVYRSTGNRAILDSVISASSRASFREAVSQLGAGRVANGHGVATYEDSRLPALVYLCNGDKAFLDASIGVYRWMDSLHMLPCGVASSEEHMAGRGSTRHIETCNVATSEWSYEKMLEITGDGKWADKIERIFFNAAAAPISRDYHTMCYYQSPNRVAGFLPAEEPRNPANVGDASYVYRPTGHDVLCCVGNSNRIIPFYIMHMWLSTPDKGIAASLYGPSQVRCVAGEDDVPVCIESRTDYPFSESINIVVKPESKVRFPLYLHVPQWCSQPSLTLNGRPVRAADRGDYLVIERKWKAGDEICLTLPMSVRVETGRETSFPTTRYFNENNRPIALLPDISNPYRCVYYGPLLLALPLRDIDANTQVEGQQWRYALGDFKPEQATVAKSAMPSKWMWQYDAPVSVMVPACVFDWQPDSLHPLPAEKVSDGEATTIRLTPYGCSKFRISMFPVFEK